MPTRCIADGLREKDFFAGDEPYGKDDAFRGMWLADLRREANCFEGKGGAIMNVIIGADHGGFPLKAVIVKYLAQIGHYAQDVGTFSSEPVDYPDYVRAVVNAMIGGQGERGIILCGSGVGACVAANKFPGIRAAVCHDTFSAHQGVEDDDMNVLCLGARVVGPELAKEIARVFLAASFSGAVRHIRRLDKIKKIENEFAGNI